MTFRFALSVSIYKPLLSPNCFKSFKVFNCGFCLKSFLSWLQAAAKASDQTLSVLYLEGIVTDFFFALISAACLNPFTISSFLKNSL